MNASIFFSHNKDKHKSLFFEVDLVFNKKHENNKTKFAKTKIQLREQIFVFVQKLKAVLMQLYSL
jgi:hypothetical protein